MASPPFSIAETTPQDNDVVLNYPAAERTFRDIVESWLLVEHDTYGHHKIKFDTTTNRDADANWSAGSLFFNNTLNSLQVYNGSAWEDVAFRAGTRVMFQQSSAPTGWTIEAGAAYNDAMPVNLTSGSVSTYGTTGVASVLAARTITQAMLPSYFLTVSDPGHGHGHNAMRWNGNTVAEQNPNDVGVAAASDTATINAAATGISVHSGGSGQSFNFDTKKFGTIIAQKDA